MLEWLCLSGYRAMRTTLPAMQLVDELPAKFAPVL
jgi:hypothetical protein